MRICITKNRIRDGFTLLELLVVIAIIGILIAILLPALAAVRQQGAIVKCMAATRSISQATASYTASHDEYWPNAFSPSTEFQSWTMGTTQYDAYSAFSQVTIWIALLYEAGFVSQDNSMEGMSCPVALQVLDTRLDGNRQTGPMWSFAYSPAFFTDPKLWDPEVPDRRNTPDAFRLSIRASRVTYPSAKVAFFEFADQHGSGEIIGSEGTPEDQRSVAVFADGHVSRVFPSRSAEALALDWDNLYGVTMPASFPFSCAPFGAQGRDY